MEDFDWRNITTATSVLMKGLREGCVCHIHNDQFASYIHEGLVYLKDPGLNRRHLLCFLTFLRSLVKLTLVLTNHGGDLLCKRLHIWLILLRKLKIYILRALIKIDCHDRHILSLSLDAFNHIFALYPCPLISENHEESCQRLCQPLFAKMKSPAKLVKLSFSDLEQQIDRLKKPFQMTCLTAKISALSCDHYKTFNKHLIHTVRSSWKLSWMEKLSQDSSEFSVKFQILELWKGLVDVKSNMTLHQMREFVSSVSISIFKKEENPILKRKWLEVFNEILCYGSTLGIQSDIPGDVSEVAHQIVRISRTEDLDFKIPEVYLGLAGDQIHPSENDDKVPDLVILQGICSVHLKSVALLVREAQCCSSSDESDSSLSSRGSSSIAEEDREMKMIEKNVVQLLMKLRFWINDILGLPSSSYLSSSIVTLFNEQDDGMIEALLCLLDAHSGLQYGSYSSRIGITCGQEEDDSMDFFNPIDAFEHFLSSISHDSSVLLDFLLSNETCFLLYLLRILKYLNKRTQHPARGAILETLRKVSVSIKKLTEKNLFPYDIKPVQKQLEKLLPE